MDDDGDDSVEIVLKTESKSTPKLLFNHKKRKKRVVSKKEQLSILEHEKFLRKMGVDPNYKRKATPLKTERKSVKLPEKKITDYEWRVQTKKDAKIYNGDVVIGQAYNKGNLVVLSSKEQSDAATGKRR